MGLLVVMDEEGSQTSVGNDPSESLFERSSGTSDGDSDDFTGDVEDLAVGFEVDGGGDGVVAVREETECFFDDEGGESVRVLDEVVSVCLAVAEEGDEAEEAGGLLHKDEVGRRGVGGRAGSGGGGRKLGAEAKGSVGELTADVGHDQLDGDFVLRPGDDDVCEFRGRLNEVIVTRLDKAGHDQRKSKIVGSALKASGREGRD